MVEVKMPGVVPGVVELALVLEALGMVDEHAQAALTGGCLRDAFCGVEPRDIDIAVWDLPMAFTSERFERAMFGLGMESVNHYNDDVHQQPSEPDKERIGWVSKYKCLTTGRNVDILRYLPSITSMEQMMLTHDHSINMFGGRFEDDGYLHVYFPWHNMGRCYQMREHVSEVRCQHMREVCTRLGWTYWSGGPAAAPKPQWEWTDQDGNKGLTNILK